MKANGLSLDQAPPEDIPLRFFLTAPLFGALAGWLILYKGNPLFLTAWHFETIALVHLITLGWLAMIMIGAFYQMIPVVVGGHVPFLSFSRFVHVGIVAGILGFTGGLMNGHPLSFLIGAALLTVSLSIFVIQLIVALFRVEANRPTVLAMRISIISLALTMILGGLLVGQLADWWTLPFNRSHLKGIHLTLGLLGWVVCLIIGVGFHVIPMFYLAHPFPVKVAWWIIYLLLITLIIFPLASLLEFNMIWQTLALLPAITGIGLFVKTLIDLFRQRKRKTVDTTLRYWQFGLLCLFISLPFLLSIFWFPNEELRFLFVLFLIGFAVSITNGMLYKIVPFLIWLHRFSSLVGKVRVPLMKDIVSDVSSRRQWWVFVATLALLMLGIISHLDGVIRLSGGLWFVSSGMLFFNLYKSYRIIPPEISE